MSQGAPSMSVGKVFWVTGLSGAGKTTVATRLAARLRRRGKVVLLLDGDVLREIFPRASGMTLEDRRHLAEAYGRLCREVALQGIDVVIATISMFEDVRRWNRAHIEKYVEIFLSVPHEELRRRDPKGIYKRLEQGTAGGVVGFDLPAEFPQTADLVIENHGETEAETSVTRILAWLDARN